MPKSMVPKKRRSRKRSSNSSSGGSLVAQGPNPQSIIYNGPSKLPEQVKPEYQVFEMHYDAQAAATAGTVWDLTVTGAQVRSNAFEWSDFAGSFREYRVLSLRYEYNPNVINAVNSSINYTPVYSVVDRDDASASGSYANIVTNTSLRVFTMQRMYAREAKMESTFEAEFISVAGDPAAYFSIKNYSTGLTASQVYGRYLVRWIVQFRTRI